MGRRFWAPNVLLQATQRSDMLFPVPSLPRSPSLPSPKPHEHRRTKSKQLFASSQLTCSEQSFCVSRYPVRVPGFHVPGNIRTHPLLGGSLSSRPSVPAVLSPTPVPKSTWVCSDPPSHTSPGALDLHLLRLCLCFPSSSLPICVYDDGPPCFRFPNPMTGTYRHSPRPTLALI